jgi:uncharacterized protein (TIGR01777 family)
MKILVSGASGLVGAALLPGLAEGGDEIVRLVRRHPGNNKSEISWDPAAGRLASGDLEGFDAVVHLGGENIAAGRWNPEKKQRIRDSRVRSTQLMADTLATASKPPQVWVCASAIGYYGDRGAQILSEDSPPGRGFLPDVCREWEESCKAAELRGIRTVQLRIGIVLSRAGGALAKMLLPFKLGLGGKLGGGKQYMSWIAMPDLVGIIKHAIENQDLRGPVNAVAPNPVTNADFTRSLGRVLRRPTIFAVPGFAVRLLFGEMGEQLLLASTRVAPAALTDSGYRFRFSELERALKYLLCD